MDLLGALTGGRPVDATHRPLSVVAYTVSAPPTVFSRSACFACDLFVIKRARAVVVASLHVGGGNPTISHIKLLPSRPFIDSDEQNIAK